MITQLAFFNLFLRLAYVLDIEMRRIENTWCPPSNDDNLSAFEDDDHSCGGVGGDIDGGVMLAVVKTSENSLLG